MHKQWGLISLYICNVRSVKCFQDNFAKSAVKCFQDNFAKSANKNAANKIHLSHVMAKKGMADS